MKKVEIELVESIRRPQENKGERAVGCLYSLFILPFSLIFLLLLVLLSKGSSFLEFIKNPLKFMSNRKMVETIVNIPDESEWKTFARFGDFIVSGYYLGAKRFGPSYFNLKTDPRIESIEEKVFGGWYFPAQNGFFLQQWNSTLDANTNLAFVDLDTLEASILKSNILSANWEMNNSSDGGYTLQCITSYEKLIYKININKTSPP